MAVTELRPRAGAAASAARTPPGSPPRVPSVFAPLFLVSAAAIGFEIALTRFFAVALWSEYGYWVISIAMAGFAFSGVALALGRDALVRRGPALLAGLPAALVAAGAVGFHLAALNPFNPLALQNPVTWAGELWHIGLYYAALLPFFFLAGLFVGLCFVLNPRRIGAVYAADLAGAGAGAAALMGLMFALPPFRLVPALLPALAAAALGATPGRTRRFGAAAALAALLAGEALLLLGVQPQVSQYKPIYAPAHTPGARVLARVARPSGAYVLLDDFTERLDTDLSNDAAMLGLPGPPRSLGLYRDGERIAALPLPDGAPVAAGAATGRMSRPGPATGLRVGYAPATLGALPYRLLHAPRVLLLGGGGGFRIAAALALGARGVTVLEPEPVLRRALRHGLGPVAPLPVDPRVTIGDASPLSALAGWHAATARTAASGPAGAGRYDLVDLAADFLQAAPADEAAFTAEAFAADLALLRPDGMLSIPVSIRDFPVYALRVLATVRRALRLAGIADPGPHVIVYRSAWTTRVLVARRAFGPGAIAAARRFCDRRSFDVSWYPGIDVARARPGIYNDLPPVSFAAGTVEAGGGPDDAIADEAGAVLAGRPTASATAFSLAPVTLDRPFFYAALRLADLPTLLRRLEVLPQPEIAALVNLAVLAQAAVIAALVLAVPLLAPRLRRISAEEGVPVAARTAAGCPTAGAPMADVPPARRRAAAAGEGGAPGGGLLRVAVFFSALGLGFLFIEIYLIAMATRWLDDTASGFALVLSAMLVASGAGALASGRFAARAGTAMAVAAVIVALWVAAVLAWLPPLLFATLGLPWMARAGLLIAVIAPAGLALGLPFPLGLARLAGRQRLLPWAWGLNGAFSVLATPLATLLAREAGYSRVLLVAVVMYAVALLSFPRAWRPTRWRDLPIPSPDAA